MASHKQPSPNPQHAPADRQQQEVMVLNLREQYADSFLDIYSQKMDLMDKLYRVLQILNTIHVHELDGRMIEFKV